jgi:alanyl-tRNA synthetase
MGGDDDMQYFSTELCGGTHVRRAGDIGMFKIIGEGAVAAGVRRIDALTGKGAVEHVAERDRLLSDAAEAIKAQPAELTQRITALLEERKRLERQVSEMRRDKLLRAAGGAYSAEGSSADLGHDKTKLAPTESNRPIAIGSTRESGTFQLIQDHAKGSEFKWVKQLIPKVPAKDLRSLADELKKQIGSGIIGFVATDEGKAAVLVAVTDDLKDRYDARSLLRVGVAVLGGQGGGGRPDMAQGGGPAVDKAAAALSAIEQAVRERAGT